jgi:hypothetical protein
MMRYSLQLVSSVALCTALVACGGENEPPQPMDVAPTGSTTDSNTGVSPVNPGTSDVDPGVSPPGSGNVSPTTSAPTVAPEPHEKPPQLAQCAAPAVGSPVLRMLTGFEFRNTINDILPAIAGKWTSSLPSNTVGETGFDNDAANRMGGQMAEGLTNTAEAIGAAVASNITQVLPCSNAGDRACAAQYLDTTGKRLFRRPLTQAEEDRYLALFDKALAQTDFATAIKWVTAGLVQSPATMYRSEIGAVQGSGRTLSQFELATELAYTFTGSAPSPELLAQAEAGTLTDPVATARALLQTEAGKNTLHRFFEAYTGYPSAASKLKPNAATNGVSYSQVSTDMVKETRAFISNILAQNGTFQDVLTSNQTNLTTQLANYYGLPTPSAELAAVERPDGQGIGLLAQGSFLASHANSDGSSPTKRGLFAYMRLMCRAEPPLPNDVPDLVAPQPGVRTTRQRYEELHAVEGSCKTCHALFDPMGYGFEHFDEAGRYRATENGLTIDPTGTVTSRDGEQTPYTSQEELAQTLADLPEVQECFAAYLATYAFGTTTACLGVGQVDALQAGAVSVADAFAGLAGEPHFATRLAQ